MPALEGDNNSDIVVTFSSSSHKEALPRDFAGSSTDGVKFTVEPSSITVNVSTIFDIEIWLRDVTQSLDDYIVVIIVSGLIELIDVYEENVNVPITNDVRLGTIRLHCLGVDSVIVDIDESQSGVFIDTNFIPAAGVDGVIHQLGQPVGGISTPINKLTILTPYIALAGLIIAVSAVIIKKRK
ncbi:MAG: hypothetical protein WBF08_00355 [Candidatus Bathyarchaeia archaeon]